MGIRYFKYLLLIFSLFLLMTNDALVVLANEQNIEDNDEAVQSPLETETEEDPGVLGERKLENSETTEQETDESINNELNGHSSDLEKEIETQNTSVTPDAAQYTVGDKGEHVRELKKQLTQLGFGNFPSNPSTSYGSVTSSVVKEFQEYYNLPATGIADRVTRDKVKEVLNPPYRDGDRGVAIVELKQKLSKLDFGNFPSNPSIFYGSVTAEVVKEFQATYGLKADGIAGEDTLDFIDNLLNSDYREGSKGEHVRELKKQLTQLGFGNFPSNPSTSYGSVTAGVVKEFQEYYNLPITGIADKVTRDKIKEVLNPPYKDGDRGLMIADLKEKLSQLGFGNFPENPSIFYGKVTAQVVESFQDMYGLKVTGEANNETLNLLDEILSSEYRNGKSGDHVRELKEKLTALGFGNFPANPSGVYGIVTEEVVKEFQEYYGLPVSGIADEKTLKKIEEELSPPYKDGSRGVAIVELKKNLTSIGFGNFPSDPSIFYGSVTAEAVKEFQSFFGLKATGIADQDTLNSIEHLINNPLKDGASGDFIVILKSYLVKVGIANWTDPSPVFGKNTENKVKEFQAYYGIPVTGNADANTIKKLNSIINSPYQNGVKGNHVVQLKKDLRELGFGNFPNNPTDSYGDVTERVVREFQAAHDLIVNGIADEVTLAKIKQLISGLRYTQYNLTIEQAVEIQMNQKAQTDQKEYAWVSKNYIDSNNKVTANALNVRTQPTTDKNDMDNKVLGTLSKGTKVDIVGEKGNWYAIKYNNNAWVHAVEKDIRYYLDPDNFINDSRQRFQFLDLSRPSGASKEVLNNYLKGKGVLDGQGQAFIDAARLHGVNDIYLISHSILETGHGTSTLAKGVEVGLNKDGKAVRVTSSNRKSLKDIKTVYNMYGIGAVDSNPLTGGATRAYNEGWDTVKKAIIGGAEFIGGDYIKNGQNTIYKMRWNPLMSEGMAWKQYATDIGWAAKQVDTMYNLYRDIGYDNPILDIPVYK